LPTKKTHNRTSLLVVYSSSTVAILTTETSLWPCACESLPRLSWSWTVLLPSDTHRKPITSFTAVLLPSVIYLLTLPRIQRGDGRMIYEWLFGNDFEGICRGII
jgi:hypothetical protein